VTVRITTRTGSDGVTDYYDTRCSNWRSSAAGCRPTSKSARADQAVAGPHNFEWRWRWWRSIGYQIDSFFDVYTELSTDGGYSWQPTTSGSGRGDVVAGD